MTKKKKYLFYTLLFTGLVVYCQQDPPFSLFRNSYNIVNPAYAGLKGNAELFFNIRSQWVGIEDGPETRSVSFNSPLNESVGLGISVVSDEIFVVSQTAFTADFSYTINVDDDSWLAFGIKGGINLFKVDLTSLGLNSDPLFTENINKQNPHLGAGFMFYTENFFFGASVPNLIKSEHIEQSNGVLTEASNEINWFLAIGYYLQLNRSLALKPVVQTRLSENTPLSIDAGLFLQVKNRIEVGAFYRFNDAVGGMFRVKMTDGILLGYSFDSLTNNLGNYNSGSHEIMLTFNMGGKSKRPETRHFF